MRPRFKPLESWQDCLAQAYAREPVWECSILCTYRHGPPQSYIVRILDAVYWD
jgi:hypothetical protein